MEKIQIISMNSRYLIVYIGPIIEEMVQAMDQNYLQQNYIVNLYKTI